jgi:hypothetical protein
VTFVVVIAIAGVLLIETLRWTFRPEARRLRQIKKLGRHQ